MGCIRCGDGIWSVIARWILVLFSFRLDAVGSFSSADNGDSLGTGDAARSSAGSYESVFGVVLPSSSATFIWARMEEGSERAKARGVKMGRKPKLTAHQRQEAIKRRDRGEPLRDIARSYNVSHPTISRLSV
jgi:hypothetical protein